MGHAGGGPLDPFLPQGAWGPTPQLPLHVARLPCSGPHRSCHCMRPACPALWSAAEGGLPRCRAAVLTRPPASPPNGTAAGRLLYFPWPCSCLQDSHAAQLADIKTPAGQVGGGGDRHNLPGMQTSRGAQSSACTVCRVHCACDRACRRISKQAWLPLLLFAWCHRRAAHARPPSY